MLVGQPDGWCQPDGAASSPPVLGAPFWALPAGQVSFTLNPHSEAGGSWSLCLEALNFRGGQGRGPGSGRLQRARAKTPAVLPPPWALSRWTCAPGARQATKVPPPWSQGVWPSLMLPSGPVTKRHLNLAPGLSPGDLRGHRSCRQAASNQRALPPPPSLTKVRADSFPRERFLITVPCTHCFRGAWARDRGGRSSGSAPRQGGGGANGRGRREKREEEMERGIWEERRAEKGEIEGG